MSYFATGDLRYPGMVLNYGFGEDPDGKIVVERSTARWSFRANCSRHPALLELARQRMASDPSEREVEYFSRVLEEYEDEGRISKEDERGGGGSAD